MNTNQLLYETAYKLLLSMLPNGLKESDLDKYFVVRFHYGLLIA